MKGIGEYVCMAGAIGFVALVMNTKAQRAGGWANYGIGFLIMLGGIIVFGLIMKACRAVF